MIYTYKCNELCSNRSLSLVFDSYDVVKFAIGVHTDIMTIPFIACG